MVTPGEYVAKVRELTDADPDHVYERPDSDYVGPRCRYTNDPLETDSDDRTAYGCLFGQVRRQLGHPVRDEHEGQSISKVLESTFGWANHASARPILAASDEAQDAQDEGKTWGQARIRFEARLLGKS